MQDATGAPSAVNRHRRSRAAAQHAVDDTRRRPTAARNLCSGQDGTAVGDREGRRRRAASPNRLVKFDVVFGPVLIRTSNPATPLAQTLTVMTDATGNALVGDRGHGQRADADRADPRDRLTTGQQQVTNFIVQNSTSAGAIAADRRARHRDDHHGPYNDRCSAGFVIDYYVYGGNAAVPRVVDLPRLPSRLSEPDGVGERRLLRGDHQRHLRRPA